MNISHALHRTIYLHIWVGIGKEDFHVIRLSNREFREKSMQ